MKVAFIMPNAVAIRYDEFFNALRSIVGTTEFFIVNFSQDKQLKGLMASEDWDKRFDRVVFLIEPQLLLSQRKIIQHCPRPVLMSMNYEDGANTKAATQLLKLIPWMRWIGVDLKISHDLNRKGYDAYPIKPINPTELLVNVNAIKKQPTLYIEQSTKAQMLSATLANLHLQQRELTDSQSSDPYTLIERGDVFLYWHEGEHYNPLPVIRAMARGAIVITSNPGRDACTFYGWQDGHNCFLLDQLIDVRENINILIQNDDVIANVSLAAIETAAYYSQSAIGREIGMGLQLPMREKRDYQQRFSLLRLHL